MVARLQPVKWLEDPFPFAFGNAGTCVADLDDTATFDMNGNQATRMLDRVAHQIGDGTLQGAGVSVRTDLFGSVGKGDVAAGRQSERGEVGSHIAAERDQVY
ncbi:hypothetical protein D3C87_1916620 [compost metagenome]